MRWSSTRGAVSVDVCVIGAGPAGLAVAAALSRKGISSLVLERGPAVGWSWRNRYDRLHLHTTRRLSSLPGLVIPRRFGRFVARADVVRYLARYAQVHQLDIATGTDVIDVGRLSPSTTDRSRWIVSAADGRQVAARTVVVATGYSNVPLLPDWQGSGEFTGQIVHAHGYRNAAPYQGKSVLVVGGGNTGTEIAVDLAEGGAASVFLSMRSVPHIIRRNFGPWAAQMTGILVRHLPAAVVDRIAALQARFTVPDLTAFGLPYPAPDLYTRVKRDKSVPVQDVGIIEAIQRRAVAPVVGIAHLTSNEVVLTDGTRLRPDVVLAATGYRTGLPTLMNSSIVENEPTLFTTKGEPSARGGVESLPGLYFLGYTVSIGGTLRDIALESRRIARAEAKEREAQLVDDRPHRPRVDGAVRTSPSG